MCGTHRSTSQSHYRIDANSAEQRALAGHVGAADHQHSCFVIEAEAVADNFLRRNQRMPKLFTIEQRQGRVVELWKWISGMLISIRSDGEQRFNLSNRFDPYSD